MRPSLDEIRARHHRQARLLADGHDVEKVARLVGNSPELLTLLLKDPQFRKLVASYRAGAVTRRN